MPAVSGSQVGVRWLWIALSALLGVSVTLALHGNSWTLGYFLLLIGISTGLASSRRLLSRLKGFRLGAVTLGALATVALLIQGAAMLIGGGVGRSSGLLPHANYASATVIALWTLAVLGISCLNRFPFVRWSPHAAGTITVIAAGLLLIAGTRSILVGLALATVLYLLARRGSLTLKAASNLLSFLALALVLGGLFVGVTVLRQDIGSGFLGAFERGPIYMAALDISTISPWVGLGDGAWDAYLGTVEPALPKKVAAHSHSVVMTLLIEGGVFGLAAGAVLASLLLRWAFLHARHAPGLGSAAFLLCAVALLSQSLVDSVLIFPSVYVPFIAAAMLLAVISGSRQSKNAWGKNSIVADGK